MQTGEVEEVPGEGDRYGRHTSGLDDEQQHPSVEKCDRGMIGLAQVSVLTAHFRQRGCQFSPYKGAAHSNDPAKNPGRQDQCGSMHLLRDDVGIYENAGTDDAAHDEHGGIEEAKLTCQAWLGSGCVIRVRRVNHGIGLAIVFIRDMPDILLNSRRALRERLATDSADNLSSTLARSPCPVALPTS